MKWKDKLIDNIMISLEATDDFLNLKDLVLNNKVNIHLAVFSEPYLSLILSGVKTIESRFSINQVSPYRKVFPKDIVLIKKSGGDVIGLFTISETNFFFNLNETKINEINKIYGKELCWNADPFFLLTKKDTNFLTLIKFDNVIKLRPIMCNKSDRSGWSIVKLGYNNTLFENI